MTRRALQLALALALAPAARPATLQARIDAAPPGSTVRVEAGEHAGPIRIQKSIALVGEPGAVIDGGRSGHVVQILAPGARVEGLTIRGSGSDLSQDHAGIIAQADGARIVGNRIEDCLHGIYLKKASGALVSGNRILGKTSKLIPVADALSRGISPPPGADFCAVDLDVNQRGNGIHLWNSSANEIERNHISDTRDGIYFSFSDRAIVRGNFVESARYGLHYMYSDENVFESNRFEGNAAGAALMYSKSLFIRDNVFANNRGRRAYGLLLQSLDGSTFRDNELRQNTVGIYLENCNANVFAGNRVEANYIGARLTGSSFDNRFSSNAFARNLHSVELDAAASRNLWAPDGRGNYWTGARPVDLDGDGVGELPHREADLLGELRRPFPAAGLLTRSPALQLVALAQSRAPLPGVPAIEDAAPLSRQPRRLASRD